MIEKEKLQRTAVRKRRTCEIGGIKTSIYNSLTATFDWIFEMAVGYGYKPHRAIALIFVFIIATALMALATWRAGDFAPNSGPILISQDWLNYVESSENPAKAWTESSLSGRDYETFNSVAYATDIVIPLISLGQEAAWAPSTSRSWWGWFMLPLEWFMILAGWIVTAIGAAAVTGVIRRD